MEDSNNITWHDRMMHKNENVEKGHQNNSYQNMNKNDNLLVLVFYFLQIPINKIHQHITIKYKHEESKTNKLEIVRHLTKHN